MSSSNPAETYEAYMVPAFFAPWATRLLATVEPRPGERVLDVACGTGVVARQAARAVGTAGEVVGIDLNPAMLEVARVAAERDGAAVDLHQGRAEDLPFPDARFDLVVSQAALMFFTDRGAAVAEMHRVLVDDGRVAVSVLQGLDRHPFYQRMHEIMLDRFSVSGVEDIFSMGDDARLHSLLSGAGFRDVEVEPVLVTARFPDPEGFIAGEIDVDVAAVPSMQHISGEERQEIVRTIRQDIDDTLGEFTDGDYVVMPFHTFIVCGVR